VNAEPSREQVRASDAERARIAAWLAFALEEGRLDLVEFERRSQASTEVVSRAELGALTADLPPAPEAELERRMRPVRTDEPRYRGPVDRRQAAAFVIGLILGGLWVGWWGSIWPLILLLVLVGVVGVLGWAFWDPYGHRGRRD
jgi:hypothetical protein